MVCPPKVKRIGDICPPENIILVEAKEGNGRVHLLSVSQQKHPIPCLYGTGNRMFIKL